MITFFVPGEPKGQPRPRAFAFTPKGGGKPTARMFTPDNAKDFKGRIYVFAGQHRPQAPMLAAVSVEIIAIFPRPKCHYGTGRNAATLKADAPRHHCGKPDRDNVEKAVLDALTQLGFWRDDGQVCQGSLTKLYADSPDEVGCSITIKELV